MNNVSEEDFSIFRMMLGGNFSLPLFPQGKNKSIHTIHFNVLPGNGWNRKETSAIVRNTDTHIHTQTLKQQKEQGKNHTFIRR